MRVEDLLDVPCDDSQLPGKHDLVKKESINSTGRWRAKATA